MRAFLAGCDVLLICKDHEREVAAIKALEAAVKDGSISQARLDLSLRGSPGSKRDSYNPTSR